MKKLLLLAITLMFISSGLNAKWWIFGSSKDPVNIKYLYINNISSDEADPQIKLYKRSLKNQMIILKGKAKSGKGEIGSIRITLNNKETWQDAKFAKDGSFNYSFKPEIGKKYIMFIEAMNTSGKTNNVDETRKEITVSAEDPWKDVKKTLDELIVSYNAEKIEKFMAYVSSDFLGDDVMLERAVRDDFNALSNIRMRYVINNISSGSGGKISVSIKYNRMVFVNKTGASSTDSGNTEMIFESKKGALKLYSMKRPLIFGLSDADNVATGIVIGETTGLAISDTGDISNSITVTVNNPNRTANSATYTFATNTQRMESGMGTVSIGDIGIDSYHVFLNSAISGKKFTGKTLSSLTLADFTGLTNPGMFINPIAGDVFGFKVGNKYYAIEVVSNNMGDPAFTIIMKIRSF